jgi:hypothetical protein
MITYLQLGDLGEDIPAEVSYEYSAEEGVWEISLNIFGMWRTAANWNLTEAAQDRIIEQIIQYETRGL